MKIKHLNESVEYKLEKGDPITLWWDNPNWSKTAPSYAKCTYVGKSKDGKYKFQSDTYGWIYTVDAANNMLITPEGKEYPLNNDSGWAKIFNESKSIKVFGAKAKKLNEWAPELTDCPACGDTSFDSKRGRCTKCSYRESLSESIEVATIADYIVDHYEFDAIDDKYACINSIRDSFKDEETISEEELEQFIGAHNGKDKIEEWYVGEPDPTGHLEGEARYQAYLNSDEFKEAKQYVIDFANECKAQGVAPVEDYREFSRIIRDADIVPSKDLYNIFLDTYNGNELNESFDEVSEYTLKFTVYPKFSGNSTKSDDILRRAEDCGCVRFYLPSSQGGTRFYACKSQDQFDAFMQSFNECKWRDDYKVIGPVTLDWDSIKKRSNSIYRDAYDERDSKSITLDEALTEDIQDDAYTAQRYLDSELPDMLDHVVSLIPNLREVEIRNIITAARKFYTFLENIVYRHSDASIEESLGKHTLSESLFDDEYSDAELAAVYGGDTKNDTPDGLETPSETEARLKEDVEVDTKAGPEEGPEFGLSSLLNQAIQDEFKTIDMYNSIALTAKEEGFEDIVSVIDEINTEENKHVGQLQEILKTVSPNAEAIDAGEVEGEEQLKEGISYDKAAELAELLKDPLQLDDYEAETFEHDMNNLRGDEWIESVKRLPDGTKGKAEFLAIFDALDDEEFDESINNSNSSPNNNIEEEKGEHEMTTRAEQIYQSFKEIEKELNGDGEAITAVIDKLYDDNREDPDYKLAYTRWADGE